MKRLDAQNKRIAEIELGHKPFKLGGARVSCQNGFVAQMCQCFLSDSIMAIRHFRARKVQVIHVWLGPRRSVVHFSTKTSTTNVSTQNGEIKTRATA